MGRTRKYGTEADRAEGRRVTRQEYNDTERAQQLRSQQNKRAYQVRKEKNTARKAASPAAPKPIFRPIPRLPGRLQLLAKAPLNFRTHLFSYYDKSRSDDHEQFAPWMTNPPYIFTPTQQQRGLFDTISSIQGHQHRIHREFDTERLNRYRTMSLSAIAQEVYADLELKIQEFKYGRQLLVENQENWTDMNVLMAETFLQWKARRAVALVKDYKALKKGKEWIFVVYGDRWGKGY